MKDDINPVIRITGDISNETISFSLKIKAPMMMGTDSKKEKSAALPFSILQAIPVKIVLPDRDIPGIIDIACAMPIAMPLFMLIFPLLFSNNFDKNKTIVVMASPIATIRRLLNAFSIKSLNKTPIIIAGIRATIKIKTYENRLLLR